MSRGQRHAAAGVLCINVPSEHQKEPDRDPGPYHHLQPRFNSRSAPDDAWLRRRPVSDGQFYAHEHRETSKRVDHGPVALRMSMRRVLSVAGSAFSAAFPAGWPLILRMYATTSMYSWSLRLPGSSSGIVFRRMS